MTSALYAAEQGNGTKTIVLLHGFGGCHAIWRDVVASLSGSARTIAYDLPGHGRSLGFPEAGHAKRTAHAILADMAARGIKNAHVAGHSMGGAVAALMALAAPERVVSLTLLAPGGFGEEINGPLLRRYAAATEAGEIRACLAAMSGPESSVSDSAVGADLEMRECPGQTDMLVEIADMITRNDRQGVIPRNLLATLAMPATVAWGADDAVLPSSQVDGLPAQFRLCLVPRAGHMLVAETPDLVCGLIRHAMEARPPGAA